MVGVWPTCQDWPLAILAFLVCVAIPIEFFDWIVGAIAAFFVLQYRRQTRRRQVAALSPQMQAEWDRWTRIARLIYLSKNGMLHSHVPAPVLSSLEMTARSWHDVREEMRTVALSDPSQALAIQSEVDATTAAAVAAASPVVLTDEQGRRRLNQMEEDTHLMSSIQRRIEAQRLRLEHWTQDMEDAGGQGEGTLRERLQRAQAERAAAEAELDEAIGRHHGGPG